MFRFWIEKVKHKIKVHIPFLTHWNMSGCPSVKLSHLLQRLGDALRWSCWTPRGTPGSCHPPPSHAPFPAPLHGGPSPRSGSMGLGRCPDKGWGLLEGRDTPPAYRQGSEDKARRERGARESSRWDSPLGKDWEKRSGRGTAKRTGKGSPAMGRGRGAVGPGGTGEGEDRWSPAPGFQSWGDARIRPPWTRPVPLPEHQVWSSIPRCSSWWGMGGSRWWGMGADGSWELPHQWGSGPSGVEPPQSRTCPPPGAERRGGTAEDPLRWT